MKRILHAALQGMLFLYTFFSIAGGIVSLLFFHDGTLLRWWVVVCFVTVVFGKVWKPHVAAVLAYFAFWAAMLLPNAIGDVVLYGSWITLVSGVVAASLAVGGTYLIFWRRSLRNRNTVVSITSS